MRKEVLYQVYVEAEGALLPVFPKVTRDVADSLVATIAKNICDGAEKAWGNPHAAPVLL